MRRDRRREDWHELACIAWLGPLRHSCIKAVGWRALFDEERDAVGSTCYNLSRGLKQILSDPLSTPLFTPARFPID
jgi:hypothetical protein